MDLSGTTYVAGTTYTVKVEATDALGNVSSATCDVLKDEAYQSASLLTPPFFIERGENQSYASNYFLVGTQQTSMNLTAAPTGTVEWFVDNALVYSEITYTDNFASKYAEGTDYKIAVQAIDAEGNRTYSADLIQNAASYVVDWGSVATSGLDKEVTVTFAEPVTSFILNKRRSRKLRGQCSYISGQGRSWPIPDSDTRHKSLRECPERKHFDRRQHCR